MQAISTETQLFGVMVERSAYGEDCLSQLNRSFDSREAAQVAVDELLQSRYQGPYYIMRAYITPLRADWKPYVPKAAELLP